MSSKWHTKTVGIKALILYILLFASVIASALSLGGISDSLDHFAKENPHHSHWYLHLLFFAALFVNIIMFGVMATAGNTARSILGSSRPSYRKHINHKDIKIAGNTYGSMFILFCIWLEFIALSICTDRISVVLGLLSLAIRGFCNAELHTLSSLYNGYLVPNTGFLKFVVAASICTQFYMDGFRSHFLIVLSTCGALTYLNGRYFCPSDADDHHHTESASEFESKLLPLDHEQSSRSLSIILSMAENILSNLIYDKLPDNDELSPLIAN